MSPRYAL
jgi:hypothetical protein